MNYIPAREFKYLTESVVANKTCDLRFPPQENVQYQITNEDNVGTYYCDCPNGPSSDLFPTLKINYERFTLNIGPKDYFLYEKDPLSGEFRCRLTFRKE